MPKSAGSEDFDFMGDDKKTKKAGAKSTKIDEITEIDKSEESEEGDEIATGGNPPDSEDTPKVVRELGSLDLATILEARKRAGSPSGLDIEAFMKEFKLPTMDIEHALHGPLPKE